METERSNGDTEPFLARVSFVCVPGDDREFRRAVEEAAASLGPRGTGAELQGLLRERWAAAVVIPPGRLAPVSQGEAVRYAYRDGGSEPTGT